MSSLFWVNYVWLNEKPTYIFEIKIYNFDLKKGSHYIPPLCGTEGPFIGSQFSLPNK